MMPVAVVKGRYPVRAKTTKSILDKCAGWKVTNAIVLGSAPLSQGCH